MNTHTLPPCDRYARAAAARTQCCTLFTAAACALFFGAHAAAAPAPPAMQPTAAPATDDLTPQPVTHAGTVTSVVLYPDRAAVTRTVPLTLEQGVWAIRVVNLPESVLPNTVQASVAAGGEPATPGGRAAPAATDAKLLGVEYSEALRADFGGTPEGIALVEKLRTLQRTSAHTKEDIAQVELDLALVEQLGVRVAANATHDAGGNALNLDTLARHLEFVAAQRRGLSERLLALRTQLTDLGQQIAAATAELDNRKGASLEVRTAVVTVAVAQRSTFDLAVTYVVDDAAWAPAYSVRTTGERAGVEIDYNARLQQSTGEDWTDVRMALSTAQPTRASAPPDIEPWFIRELPPPVPDSPITSKAARMQADNALAAVPGAPPERGDPADSSLRAAEIDAMGRDAAVQSAGIAVSFDLPRVLTVPSNASKEQRTRIATVTPASRFTYTAQPIVTEDVYLRGTLTNDSGFQFLPGRAQIFMGGDFIGETDMPGVAPGNEFTVYFGPDRALRATRQLVSQTTGASGFFGGSQTTTWNYRVLIDNGTGREAAVELFDRRPISRNEKIVCAVSKLSRPLSTDKPYTEGPMTQGILRWDITAPATARGDNAVATTWTIEISRPNGVLVAPLPAN